MGRWGDDLNRLSSGHPGPSQDEFENPVQLLIVGDETYKPIDYTLGESKQSMTNRSLPWRHG